MVGLLHTPDKIGLFGHARTLQKHNISQHCITNEKMVI